MGVGSHCFCFSVIFFCCSKASLFWARSGPRILLTELVDRWLKCCKDFHDAVHSRATHLPARDLFHLGAFQTTDVVFARQKNAFLFCHFANLAFVRFLLFRFHVCASLLTLVRHVTTELELRSILQEKAFTFNRFRRKSNPFWEWTLSWDLKLLFGKIWGFFSCRLILAVEGSAGCCGLEIVAGLLTNWSYSLIE